MQTAQKVRIVVEPVSGTAHLVKVMAAIAGGRLFLCPFADDVQLLAAEFGHPGQHFLKVHYPASLPRPVSRCPPQAYGGRRVQYSSEALLKPGAPEGFMRGRCACPPAPDVRPRRARRMPGGRPERLPAPVPGAARRPRS